MSPSEFRRAAHEAVDWMADYLEGVSQRPVLSAAQPGELTASLPESAPEKGEVFGAVMADFERLILPAITHWNHPRFLAYFSISGSPPGILAEMLAATLNVNGMLWRSSPAVTELEQVTLGWLRQWLGLPPEYFGIIYDTASTSTLHAVVAAREMAGNGDNLTLYTSEQAHSSVDKAAVTAGIPRRNIRKIGTRRHLSLDPARLAEAVESDRAAGLRPFCIVATVGTTPSAAADPVAEILPIARSQGLWLHVDAAYGGAFCILSEKRDLFAGCDQADSLVVNPHKTLLTPVDLSAFYTRRPEALRQAFSLVPEYLRTQNDPRAVSLMDYGFQLGRRFRALKLWFVMRMYGRQGIEALLREQLRIAGRFAQWVQEDERFELCAPVQFTLVCFRLRGSDEKSRELLERLNRSGLAFLSHTVLDGRFVLRLAVGNFQTQESDLRQVWDRIQELSAGGGE